MPRLLTLFVAAYWTTFFAILALAALGEVRGAGFPVLHALVSPAGSPFQVPAGAPVSALLATGFLLVTMLFVWTMATVLFEVRQGDGEEPARIALASAAGAMAVLLALGVWSGTQDVLSAVTLQFIALLASHGVIQAEAARRDARSRAAEPVDAGTARAMAIGAARHSMLSRLSRRDPSPTKRF
ncbi:hypothetical protein [Aquibium microcysteis]|uniref:hypothetical protein n=1 Tax=Aquibium microcysteis TaxID=675281 RepID=UPI00165CF41A|nr:hypothetical protein [Aquibium microcysteis]